MLGGSVISLLENSEFNCRNFVHPRCNNIHNLKEPERRRWKFFRKLAKDPISAKNTEICMFSRPSILKTQEKQQQQGNKWKINISVENK